jgi:hypothetical protein
VLDVYDHPVRIERLAAAYEADALRSAQRAPRERRQPVPLARRVARAARRLAFRPA